MAPAKDPPDQRDNSPRPPMSPASAPEERGPDTPHLRIRRLLSRRLGTPLAKPPRGHGARRATLDPRRDGDRGRGSTGRGWSGFGGRAHGICPDRCHVALARPHHGRWSRYRANRADVTAREDAGARLSCRDGLWHSCRRQLPRGPSAVAGGAWAPSAARPRLRGRPIARTNSRAWATPGGDREAPAFFPRPGSLRADVVSRTIGLSIRGRPR